MEWLYYNWRGNWRLAVVRIIIEGSHVLMMQQDVARKHKK